MQIFTLYIGANEAGSTKVYVHEDEPVGRKKHGRKAVELAVIYHEIRILNIEH